MERTEIEYSMQLMNERIYEFHINTSSHVYFNAFLAFVMNDSGIMHMGYEHYPASIVIACSMTSTMKLRAHMIN